MSTHLSEIAQNGDTAGLYQHYALAREDNNRIRVLEILPSASPAGLDTIECRMHVIAVDSEASYDAVSYVWGDPAATKTILVDGSALTVRVNIWNFLWQMRDEGYTGSLWIDAICIQQQDIPERSHQVRLMGQIYSKARMVHVWLGCESEDKDVWQALQLLLPKEKKSLYTVAAKVQLQEMDYWTVSQWESLRSLFSAEYWSRLWIVQEFILARTLELRCGRIVLPYASLNTLGHSMRELLRVDGPVRPQGKSRVTSRDVKPLLAYDIDLSLVTAGLVKAHRKAKKAARLKQRHVAINTDIANDANAQHINELDLHLPLEMTPSYLLYMLRTIQEYFFELQSNFTFDSLLVQLGATTHYHFNNGMECLRDLLRDQAEAMRCLNLSVGSEKLNLEEEPFNELIKIKAKQEEEYAAMKQVKLSSNPSLLKKILTDINDSTALALVRQRPEGGSKVWDESSNLLDLVCRYAEMDCMDPRDHVYALLSLADSTNSIWSDYSKSSSELFQDVFDLLKTRVDVYQHKLYFVERLRTIGSALQLTKDDRTVKLIFDEIGGDYAIEDDWEDEVTDAQHESSEAKLMYYEAESLFSKSYSEGPEVSSDPSEASNYAEEVLKRSDALRASLNALRGE